MFFFTITLLETIVFNDLHQISLHLKIHENGFGFVSICTQLTK